MLIQIWSLVRFFLRHALSLVRIILSALKKVAGPIDHVLDKLGAGYLLYFLPGSCSQLGRVYWLIFIGGIGLLLLWLVVTIAGYFCERCCCVGCGDVVAGFFILLIAGFLVIWFIVGPVTFLRLIVGVDKGSY